VCGEMKFPLASHGKAAMSSQLKDITEKSQDLRRTIEF